MSAPVSATSPSEAPTDTFPTVGRGATGGAGDDDGAAERGRLDISFSVIRRIAEHAADSSEPTRRSRRRLMGGAAGTSAKVSGYGDQVDLRIEVPLVYPTPIGPAVASVRDTVRERVQTLTGYTVRTLDVTVSALTAPTTAAAASGRVS